MIDAALLGLDLSEAMQMPEEEYHARVLAAICSSAIACHQPDLSRFVCYDELPMAVWEVLPACFGFTCSPADQSRMRERARFGGKHPSADFVEDRDEKQRAATAAVHVAVDVWLSPLLQRMRAIGSAPTPGKPHTRS
jgi:hypothetical protein